MTRSTRWLWPIVGIFAIAWAGCDSAPLTDETDPLPKVFDNKDIDRTKFAGPGSGMGGGMGRGGGGGMGMGQGGGDRHGKGGRDGTGGGSMDGTGGGEQKAKAKKDSDKKADGPATKEPDKAEKPDPSDDTKKPAAPADTPTDSSKPEKKEGSDKEQP